MKDGQPTKSMQSPQTNEDVSSAETAKDETRNKSKIKRFVISSLKIIVVLMVVVTVASLIFNALTQPPQLVQPLYGSYVLVGNTKVHYQKWGENGSPIVLVPGFLETSYSWTQAASALAKYHQVYAIDLAGYGFTQYNGAYSLDDESHLIEGFITALHINKPLLVGHSLGAAVVGKVAIDQPQSISGVIFADGDGLKLSPGPGWIRNILIHIPLFTTTYRLVERMPGLDKSIIQRVCGPICQLPTNQELAAWLMPIEQLAEEKALKSIAGNGVIGLSASGISSINIPHAIIWGEFDKAAGGSLLGAKTNLHNPPTYIISGAGHLSMIANPTQFAQSVETFLTGSKKAI